jgi:predicted nucleic acid-binding protein
MYLLDTNIFLEILLGHEKQDACKKFINKHSEKCQLSDFTLYSIGIALFRKNLFEEYGDFYNDVISIITLHALPLNKHSELIKTACKLKLDYDDAYQYEVAKHYNLIIVTMDKDFKAVKDIDVMFL